jgi:hypothetical protein
VCGSGYPDSYDSPASKGPVRGGPKDRPLILPAPNPNRTIVYIDGFNLYYGAVRGTPWKWLDLARFFHQVRPADSITRVRYFTAMVTGPTKPNQELYLKALATTPLVDVILGKFKAKNVECKVSSCTQPGRRFFKSQEEKRTDVNIAVSMLDDAYQDLCDNLVLVSGDSDLVPAIRTIKDRFHNKRVIVYVPAQHPQRGHAVELRGCADINRDLPLNLLKPCQFANPLPDGNGGFIAKPTAW